MDLIICGLFVLLQFEEMKGDNVPGQSEHADNFPSPVGSEGLRLRHKTDVDSITSLRSVELATTSSVQLSLYSGAA